MTFNFSEKFYGADFFNKLQHVYPFIKFRIRDSISIDSRKCSFEDFGVFTISVEDKVIVPKFASQGIKGNEVNLIPLLCVGMIEFLLDTSENNEDVLDIFEECLLTRISHERVNSCDIEDFLTSSNITDSSDNEYGFILAHSLRFGHSISGKVQALKILNYLYFCAIKLPSLFAEVFFDLTQTYLGTMRAYCTDNARLIGVDNSTKVTRVKTASSVDYKKYSIKTPRKSISYVSNCRGLGLACLNIFVLNMLRGAERNDIFFSEEHLNQACENFFMGLGDDVTAKIISGKLPLLNDAIRVPSGYVVFYPNRIYNLNDSEVKREVFEEEFLYRKAFNVSFNDGVSSTECRDVSVHYFSVYEFVPCVAVIQALCDTNNDALERSTKLLKDAQYLMDRKSRKIDSLEKSLKHASDNFEVEKKKVINSYEKKIKDLEYQLEQKSQIIAQLSEKNTILNSRMSSFFCESDFEDDNDVVIEEVTQEEIINYINGFSYLLVGGREGLAQKLEDYGWKNINQISNVNNSVLSSDSSSRPNIDFIIINTKFVSHNLVRSVESKFSDLTDRVIYFNGTNIDYLTRVTIDFIKKYMEE